MQCFIKTDDCDTFKDSINVGLTVASIMLSIMFTLFSGVVGSQTFKLICENTSGKFLVSYRKLIVIDKKQLRAKKGVHECRD